MAIKRLSPGKRMSEGVVHGDRIILAGQVAVDGPADIKGQAVAVLAQIDALLKDADSDKSKVLFAQIFLADIGDYVAFNEVWDAWVDQQNPPARACIQSPLVRPEWKVEVQVHAAL
ncbi:MAG: RidA family protein [Pseudomonadota bacterium]